MANIRSASPTNISEGTNDLSGVLVTPSPKQYPQHLPLVLLYTAKGGYEREVVDGAEFNAMYGSESLDPRSKYFNHASALASSIFTAGGQIIVQRLKVDFIDKERKVPEKSSKKAAITIFATTVENPTMQAFTRDGLGNVIPTPDGVTNDTFTGLEVNYLAIPHQDGIDDIGTEGNIIADTADTFIKDYANGGTVPATATLYPLFTIHASVDGEYYNNLGFTINPLIGEDEDADVTEGLLSANYEIGVVNKSSGVKKIVTAITGDNTVPFVFKEDATHPVTNVAHSLSDLFPSSYGNLTDPDIELKTFDFGDVEIYDGLTTFLTHIESYEADTIVDLGIESFFNFDSSISPEDRSNMMNFISLFNASGLKYEAIRSSSEDVTSPTLTTASSKRVDLSSDTPVYLTGGQDGDVTDLPNFENMVTAELAEYADADSRVIDTATNKESIFYDSGFSLDTKLLLNQLTFFRRDIIPVIGTYVFNKENREQSISEAISYGSLIKTALSLAPESKVYGTSAARGVIVMGSGKLSNLNYKYYLPQTIELAIKATKYMGAGNQKWKGRYRFSRQPGSVVGNLIDIRPEFIPNSIKTKLWKTGMIWTQADDRSSYFFPATQTVYDDDTSILNIFTVMVGITHIVKLNDAAWRTYTGATDLSNAELKEEVETFITDNLLDAFDKQLTVIPEVTITKRDSERGYSWHLKVKVYANNQKTVMVSHIEAHRASDLVGA